MTVLSTYGAVLTGDLMQSSAADPQATESAMHLLTQAVQEVADWTAQDPRLTRFRGDGWQIVLSSESELFLRVAVFLYSRLKSRKGGLTTRISVGVGAIDDLGTQNLSDARGAAFNLSGRGLDRMAGTLLKIDFDGIGPLHQGFIQLLEPMMWRWTPEQAEAVSHSLHPDWRSQKDIASLLGISEQAVSYRLRGAFDPALRQALKFWESDIKMLSPMRKPANV